MLRRLLCYEGGNEKIKNTKSAVFNAVLLLCLVNKCSSEFLKMIQNKLFFNIEPFAKSYYLDGMNGFHLQCFF